MKCPKCQKEIPDRSTFCSYCGAKIEPPKRKRSPLIMWILTGIAVISVLVIIVTLSSGKNKKAGGEQAAEEESSESETPESVEESEVPAEESEKEDEDSSGDCGDTLSWVKNDNGTLTISGEGDMWDYDSEGPNRSPWAGDRSIRKVIVKEGVRSVGKNAFSGCTEMEEVELPESLTEMHDGAFTECSSLEEVDIPENVTTIENNVFVDCSSLTTINVEEENTVYTSVEGVLYDSEVETLIVCPAGRTGTFEIPEGITYIESFAFCSSLLTEITLPEGIIRLEEQVFYRCERLTTITLPASLTEIGNNAFSWCDLLTEIYFRGTLEQWESITIEGENDGLTQAEVYCEEAPEEETVVDAEEIERIREEAASFLNTFVARADFNYDFLFTAKGDSDAYMVGDTEPWFYSFWYVIQPLHAALYEEDPERYSEETIWEVNTNRPTVLSDEDYARAQNDPDISQWIHTKELFYSDGISSFYADEVWDVLERLYGAGMVSPEEYFRSKGFETSDGFFLIPLPARGLSDSGYYHYDIHDIEIGDDGIIKATVSGVVILPDYEYTDVWYEPVWGTYTVYDVHDLYLENPLDQGTDDSLTYDYEYRWFAQYYDQDVGAEQFEIYLYEDSDGIHIYPFR